MHRTTRVAGLVAGLLVLSGCGLGSVHPIVEEAEFEPALVGTWVDPEDGDTASLSAAEDGYRLVLTDSEGETSVFHARSGRLGPHQVMDIWPDLIGAGNSLYHDLLLPLHAVVFLDSIGERLGFRLLDVDSLSAYLQRQPDAVAHLRTEDRLILTAGTAELRRFLEGYAARPGVLTQEVWERRDDMP